MPPYLKIVCYNNLVRMRRTVIILHFGILYVSKAQKVVIGFCLFRP